MYDTGKIIILGGGSPPTNSAARNGEHTAVVLVGSDPRGEWRQAYGLAPPVRLLGLVDELR